MMEYEGLVAQYIAQGMQEVNSYLSKYLDKGQIQWCN